MKSGTQKAIISILALLLLASCGGGPEGAQEESAEPATGSFVGEIPGTDAFVAVVAAEQKQGEDEREVLTYVCDTPYGWFWGSAAENEFSLTAAEWDTSEAEVAQEVEVALTPGVATGTLTLADGRALPFEATPATGVAGLYEATVSPDGLLNGPSERGGEMDARLAEDESGDPVIIGTFTGPDSESVPFETGGGNVEPGDLIRVVVLPDGRFNGKVKRQTSGGDEFVSWALIDV